MRKIEEKMVQAVKDGKNFRLTNTDVYVYDSDNTIAVSLHGNCIARYYPQENRLKLIYRGGLYGSRTTLCRYNALLYGLGYDESIVQRDWCIYVRHADGTLTDIELYNNFTNKHYVKMGCNNYRNY